MNKIIFVFVISIVSILFLGFAFRFLPLGMTGLVGGNTSVSIGEELKGKISAVIFKPQIEFGEIQNITVEFTNIGSVPLTEKIEIRIYYNSGGSLTPIGYYFDSQATLKPAMSRAYSIGFLPPAPGTFYIRARVTYEGQVLETWEAFLVVYTLPSPPIEIVYPSAPSLPLPTVTEEIGIPSMDIEYPYSVEMLQGEAKTFNVLVKNTGGISLTNLRLSVSTSDLISFDFYPKQVFRLYPNDSSIFLISVTANNTAAPGTYPFDFDVITTQIKEARSIELKVTSIPKPVEEDLNAIILNYEYMISETQNEIDNSAYRGIDVSQAQNSLDKAKSALDIAKMYYEQKRYDDVKSKLDDVKKYLEDAIYQLSVAGIVVSAPAFAPWYLISIPIIIVVIFFILITWKRKKKKKGEERPKLLREMETES